MLQISRDCSVYSFNLGIYASFQVGPSFYKATPFSLMLNPFVVSVCGRFIPYLSVFLLPLSFRPMYFFILSIMVNLVSLIRS